MAVTDIPTDGPTTTVGRSIRTRRRLVGLVLAVGLVAALAWAGWWWRHPDVFPDAPDEWTVDGGGVLPANGRAFTVGLTEPVRDAGEATVVLESAEAHVLSDTAQAGSLVQVCTLRDPDDGFLRLDEGGLDDWCSDVADVDGVELPIGRDAGWQLVVTFWGTQPGEVRVHGVDLTYRHGLQRGTQRIGEHIRLRYE